MSLRPSLVELTWPKVYRLIPSKFPPIDLFEDLVDPKDFAQLCSIEMLTNPRLREQLGGINLVKTEDIITGRGTTVVMAAFTHINKASRFTDGSYGVYYAANNLVTAIKETIYHREVFMRQTLEQPGAIDMRVYINHVKKPLHDIRSKKNKRYQQLHHKSDYSQAQIFGRQMKGKDSWGICYRSVRDMQGECIAALRPPTISVPHQGSHYCYIWDGNKINSYYQKKDLRTL